MARRVTFVVPCYNYGRYLREAVDSLLAQTFTDLDIIVVNDASSDDTEHVLDAYRDDPRVRTIHHQTNRGHVYSYNEGMEQAEGEFVGVLSADDFALSRDAVERQIAVFESDPDIAFVYSAPGVANGRGEVIDVSTRGGDDYVKSGIEELRTHLLWDDQVPHSGTLMRRTALARIGLHDARFPHACDWDLWLRLASHYSVGYISTPLYAYRIHDTNMSHGDAGATQSIRELIGIVRATFEQMPAAVASELASLRTAAQMQAAIHTVWCDLGFGRPGRARRGVVAAPLFAPRLLFARSYYAAWFGVLYLTVFGHDRYRRRFGGFAT